MVAALERDSQNFSSFRSQFADIIEQLAVPHNSATHISRIACKGRGFLDLEQIRKLKELEGRSRHLLEREAEEYRRRPSLWNGKSAQEMVARYILTATQQATSTSHVCLSFTRYAQPDNDIRVVRGVKPEVLAMYEYQLNQAELNQHTERESLLLLASWQAYVENQEMTLLFGEGTKVVEQLLSTPREAQSASANILTNLTADIKQGPFIVTGAFNDFSFAFGDDAPGFEPVNDAHVRHVRILFQLPSQLL